MSREEGKERKERRKGEYTKEERGGFVKRENQAKRRKEKKRTH